MKLIDKLIDKCVKYRMEVEKIKAKRIFAFALREQEMKKIDEEIRRNR